MTRDMTDNEFQELMDKETELRMNAMHLHSDAENAFQNLTEAQRQTMDSSDKEVANFLALRDGAYKARIEFQQISGERMMAEPQVRYRHSMARQENELLRLVEARELVMKMMYAQSLVEEHELMAAVMVQGPERLDDHTEACKKTDHFREQWEVAQRTLETLPADATLAPWASITVPEQSKDDDENVGEEEE